MQLVLKEVDQNDIFSLDDESKTNKTLVYLLFENQGMKLLVSFIYDWNSRLPSYFFSSKDTPDTFKRRKFINNGAQII